MGENLVQDLRNPCLGDWKAFFQPEGKITDYQSTKPCQYYTLQVNFKSPSSSPDKTFYHIKRLLPFTNKARLKIPGWTSVGDTVVADITEEIYNNNFFSSVQAFWPKHAWHIPISKKHWKHSWSSTYFTSFNVPILTKMKVTAPQQSAAARATNCNYRRKCRKHFADEIEIWGLRKKNLLWEAELDRGDASTQRESDTQRFEHMTRSIRLRAQLPEVFAWN